MSGERLIETERLWLAGWEPEQLEDLVQLHGDPEVARFLSERGLPWTRDEARARLAIWLDEFARFRMGKLRLVRKSDGVLVGRAGYSLYPPTGEPEIGFALYPEHWGSGYATEAASALRDWLFRDTDWDHFIGFADVRNHASLAVLRRIGMEPTHVEATMGMSCQFLIKHKPAA